MEVRFTSGAIKDIKRLGPARAAILAKIEQYAADPASLANNVKALSGSNQLRLRVGDYRVLFSIDDNGILTVMLVEAIRHRREAYD